MRAFNLFANSVADVASDQTGFFFCFAFWEKQQTFYSLVSTRVSVFCCKDGQIVLVWMRIWNTDSALSVGASLSAAGNLRFPKFPVSAHWPA